LGKPFRNIISIKIKENEMIGELKRCIKAEKDYFETRTNTHIGSNNTFPCFDLFDSNEILSYFGIKDIWKENPPKSNLHVVVKIEERNVGELNHIISNELKLMAINISPNQVITCEEDKCVMKNLDKIKSVFANSIYNYNPDHLHVMISSNAWKEVHCKAIYKKTSINLYRTHDGNTQGEFIRSDSMLERIMWGKFIESMLV
ncbi:hypothetical protein GLOIN_2v1594024, partial [Rhizophagus irregularis DAOM 181602=DAOM 197198]